MLKFKASRPQGPLFVLGLSRKNIERLQAKEPIFLSLASIGGPQVDVLLYAGETEASMMQELVREGLLPAALADDGAPN